MRKPWVSFIDVISISDPDDPRIAAYREVRERDLVGRQGLFIAEGEVVLRVLASNPLHQAQSVLIDEKRLAKLAPILGMLDAGVPVYAAGQGVIDAIAGFHLHRGILALGRHGEAIRPADLLASVSPSARVLCLMGISNHDNLGGLFRNAAAFGVEAVLLDGACCDPLYRKAIRVSVGAALSLPFARLSSEDDLVGLLESQGFEPIALSPTGGEPLSGVSVAGRCALILGAEGAGLSASVLSRTRRVSIPMAGDWDSLNVATAGAIALHQFCSAD